MKEVSITYRDKSQNTLRVFLASSSHAPSILILPAMGVRASYYKSLAKALAERGMNVITADYRGQGHFSVRPSYSLNFSYETLIQDLGEVLAKVRELSPESDMYLLGHSLGGQVASLFTSRYPHLVKGLILCAACSVYYKGWEGRQALGLRTISYIMYPLSCLVGYFPGNTVGFGGKEARGVIRDWCHTVQTGRYELKDADFDYEGALSQTVLPIFAASVEEDWLATPQSVKNLYQKFHPDSLVHSIHLSPTETGIPQLDHFSWAKYPDYIARAIGKWMKEVQ